MIDHLSRSRRIGLRIVIIVSYVLIFAGLFYAPRYRSWLFSERPTLNVFTFSEFFTTESLRKFEQAYNVDVNVNYYDTNDELFAKFKITGGVGYDVVIPSDYMVEKLCKENFLAPLDHSKLPIFDAIDEALLGHYFDKENRFSIPIHWVTYGVLYKKSIFTQSMEQLSLQYLFQEPRLNGLVARPYRIAVFDDAIEAIFYASLYLYGDLYHFDDVTLEAVQEALIRQKKMVAAYLGHDIRNFLFTDLFQLALTASMNARRLMDETDEFDFKIPEEGSLFVIENLSIPSESKNKDLAYKFINFMLEEEIALARTKQFGANPSNKYAYQYISNKYLDNKNFFPDKETFSRLHLTHNQVPLATFEQIWLKVKSK